MAVQSRAFIKALDWMILLHCYVMNIIRSVSFFSPQLHHQQQRDLLLQFHQEQNSPSCLAAHQVRGWKVKDGWDAAFVSFSSGSSHTGPRLEQCHIRSLPCSFIYNSHWVKGWRLTSCPDTHNKEASYSVQHTKQLQAVNEPSGQESQQESPTDRKPPSQQLSTYQIKPLTVIL